MTEKKLNVHKEFKKLMNLMARFARSNQISKGKCIVSRSQALILEFIYDNTKDNNLVYQKDIEQHFSIRRSTATESLKRLESQGLITRTVSLTDARLKEITLTKEAKSFVEKSHDKLMEFSEIICRNVTDEETEIVCGIFKKMQENLKEFTNPDEKNS
ncbi:MAG: MarR family transcriptional regulator [Clostridia bacterium]|nr:MarR family transcriptional regulator [Clostridia bacterium]